MRFTPRIKKSFSFLFTAILSLFTPCLIVHAQPDETGAEYIADSLFKTILFHRSGWDLSMPVLIDNEDNNLTLGFDYLGESRHDLSFSIRKCRYNWEFNDVAEQRYLSGFNDVPVYDYIVSRNTLTDYIHYEVAVPGEDLQLQQSGNYLLEVHPYGEPNNVLFTRRFCIAERRTEVRAKVRPLDAVRQELEVEIDLGELTVDNPMAEIKVVVIRNYNWNDNIRYTMPPVLRNNILYLDLPFQLVSSGMNEFRNFDTKSTRYLSDRIAYFDYQVPYSHAYLKPDELEPHTPYFSSSDLNGRFYIENTEGNDRHSEADYLFIHFTLKAASPLTDTVFLYGALTNWKTDRNTMMHYNYNKGVYQKTLRLKQGFYDYMYVTTSEEGSLYSTDQTEGNHSETENDFLIFVYYRANMSDFDRLVGYSVVNSEDR